MFRGRVLAKKRPRTGKENDVEKAVNCSRDGKEEKALFGEELMVRQQVQTYKMLRNGFVQS